MGIKGRIRLHSIGGKYYKVQYKPMLFWYDIEDYGWLTKEKENIKEGIDNIKNGKWKLEKTNEGTYLLIKDTDMYINNNYIFIEERLYEDEWLGYTYYHLYYKICNKWYHIKEGEDGEINSYGAEGLETAEFIKEQILKGAYGIGKFYGRYILEKSNTYKDYRL